MAAPTTMTVQNMTGTYTLNKTLSDSTSELLKLQNINFIIRQAVAFSTITNNMTQYTEETADGKKVMHLDQKQVSTGGIKNNESRVLDWEWRESNSAIWGKARVRARLTKLSEIEDEWLREGWSQDCIDGEVLEDTAESLADTWVVTVVWGFAEVNGERKHVRKIVCKKGDRMERVRHVWDWKE